MKRIVLWGLEFLLVFVVASAQAQNRGGPNFKGTLHVQSNFAEGGPTVIVENVDATGDVSIDFRSGDDLLANISVIGREVEYPRLAILQSSDANLPLTLVENGGNVGIGTSEPGGPLHVAGDSGEGVIINVENLNPDGDVPIDFLLDGQVIGNVGVVRKTTENGMTKPRRFVVLERNDTDVPLTLAENRGNVGIGRPDPTYPLHMGSGAYVTPGGVWTDASSREYKDNINGLKAEDAIETLQGLNPVTFSYKVSLEENHVGFVAEEVPHLVATKDRKGLSPMDIVAVLTKVVQEQQKTISTLREELNELKGKVR
jgi:hypothetical protein